MEENREETETGSAEEKMPITDPGQAVSFPDQPVRRRFPWEWIGALILAVAFSVMLTYTLASAAARNREIQSLQSTVSELPNDETARDLRNVQSLINALQERSFYADSMGNLTGEALLKAVLDAYINETGDLYAAYYTEAEYSALMMDMAGNHVGIGVTITRDSLDLSNGTEEETEAYRIEEVYSGSGAEEAGLAVGEWICAVWKDDACLAVGQLGLEAAAKEIRGEAGTPVKLDILHLNGTSYERRTVTVTRSAIVTHSVRLSYAQSDPTVAVVRISTFDYTTPTQFEQAVETAKENGAEHFVFDVRGNPGGEMSSIFAVLSNFLQEGDLVLAMVDAEGNRVEYRMKPAFLEGAASGCTVTKEQIGRYRDLDFVVLCDENTASAAEVFTATLRDFHLAKEIVGQRTFGKGIVQNYKSVALEGVTGYLKVTIAEYVTECGKSYHKIGIDPTVWSFLPKEVRGKSTTFLPWEDDRQLQTAVALFAPANNQD